MFLKELENLIQATLEDGVLEPYELEALQKRAKAEGVDLTELEIYINSLLQKRNRELKEKEAAAQQQADEPFDGKHVHSSLDDAGMVVQVRAQSPASPRSSASAWGSASCRKSMHSFTALTLPGRLTISVRFRITDAPRDSMARGVI